MKTFTVTSAFNVPCYSTFEIEAETHEQAVEQAKRMLETGEAFNGWDVDYSQADEHRIVDIEIED